jgi:V/A-type H+-transporting ATPase subunit I
MAVSQMQRVRIFAHNSHRASLINDLQNLEIVHINNINEETESPSESEVRVNVRNIQSDLSRLLFTIDYLTKFEPKKGFIDGFLGGGKPLFTSQEYTDIGEKTANGEWRSVCDECQSMEEQATRLSSRINRIHTEQQSLSSWRNLDVPVEEINDTEKVAIRMGVISANMAEELRIEIQNSNLNLAFEVVGTIAAEVNIIVMFLKSQEHEISLVLAKYEFFPESLPITSGKVSDQLNRINEELSEISRQQQEIINKSTNLAKPEIKQKLMAIYDYLVGLSLREEIRESFALTDYTFMIDGWIRKKDVEKLKDKIKKYDELEITLSDPAEDEEPPVELENGPIAEPYRMVTNLYGRPHYREIDPTKLFAPFLTIGFAICLTDAGYGFTVALIAAIIMIINRKKGSNDLIRILFLCGLTTGLVGTVTGGWYGFTAPQLPPFMRKLVLIDPNVKQIEFLALIVLFGYIEVWFGFVVKMYISLKGRDWMGAFCDQLPWVLVMLLTAVPVLGIVGLEVYPIVKNIAVGLILLCAFIIVVFAGRDIKNIAGRIGTGVFALYGNVTGTFGDTLSYMRLFALGLATGIIASSVNTIAGMLWTSTPGKIAAIAVLIFGHPFNIAINALGGFIHSMRLQFVEFFTKFYEGGGTEFRPFKKEHVYVAVSDEVKS